VAAQILEYLSTGGTSTSVNFPVLSSSPTPQRHRFAHVHENVPGMLAKINDLFARHGVNIAGQRLETRGRLGYTLIDVALGCDLGIVEELRRIPQTIRARLVY
jgi:D-3-phosphoglycerate dehydrogenase